MNTLRSTERSLTLIAFRNKASCGIGKTSQRGIPAKVAEQIAVSLKKTSVIRAATRGLACQPRASWNAFGRNNPIKLHKGVNKSTQSLSLSTSISNSTSALSESLLNPNKPNPDDLKTLAMEPIVPLTLPRFPKSAGESAPSVTKVLQATMPAASRYLLDKWKAGMIKKLGIAGFNKYTQDTFERGRVLHALLATSLLRQGEPVEGEGDMAKEVNSNLWKSIRNVVRDKISNVRLVEHIVTHRDLNYRGIVDCVAVYENELVVVDFKTAEKPKKDVKSLYDNPLQVTAYCGAINNDSSIPNHVIDRNICAGLVIVAYCDGSEASTYYLDRESVMNQYWSQWKSRLGQFSSIENKPKP